MIILPGGGVTAHGVRYIEVAGRLYSHRPSIIKKARDEDQILLTVHSGQAGPKNSKARFRCVVAGRRWGKTHWVCTELVEAAAAKPKQRVWYVAPTYSMAKQIAWEKLKEIIPKNWIARNGQGLPDINETSLTIRLLNGSRISLKGADRPDSLRGVGIHFLALDEYQDMKSQVWTALRPTLTDTKGRCIFIGTPKSFNHLYKMYRRGQDSAGGRKHNPQWASWQFKTSDSPFISRIEIENAKRDLDVKTYKQEYEASFEAMTGRIYYHFDRRFNVRPCPYDPSLPVYVGQDFNIDPMSSVICQVHGEEIWVTGEMSLRSSNTEEVCRELIREYGEPIIDRATIYPDPAGNSRQHARGESDVQIFREWGFKRVLFRKKHPPQRDRYAAVNRAVCDAGGRRRLFVDPSCKHLTESFERMIYKEGSTEPDKSEGFDHMTDGLGYFVEFEYPVRQKFKMIGLSR